MTNKNLNLLTSNPIFHAREQAVVLAALRYWQREGVRSEGQEHDIATDSGRLEPLSESEIDALCERLNMLDLNAELGGNNARDAQHAVSGHPIIKVSLDGGVTFHEAKEGVRIVYEDVMIPGEDGTGEFHLNATHEGLISDLWTTRDEPLDHNIGTSAQMLDDLVSELVDDPVFESQEAPNAPKLDSKGEAILQSASERNTFDAMEAAAQFNVELFDSVETLGDIAREHGVRTLTDLMYLQDAILTGGFIDAWTANSHVTQVIEKLPSAKRWMEYVAIYDADETLLKKALFPKDDLTAVRERVENLPRLQQQAGAAYTLYLVATKALQGASGDANGVDWGTVHKEVFAKAVGQDQQPVAKVLDAIKRHSPGAVTAERIAQVDAMAESRKMTIESLESAYIDAASELLSAQSALGNIHDQTMAFITARDTLAEHPEFSGFLPETYFSGGDLDPAGVAENSRDASSITPPEM